MTRHQYLQAVIHLYLEQPDTPSRARRRDWAIAATFYDRRLPIEIIEHAFRLATLRRHTAQPTLEPIHSLAYFREVLNHLTPDCCTDQGYVDYIAQRHQELLDRLQLQDPIDSA